MLITQDFVLVVLDILKHTPLESQFWIVMDLYGNIVCDVSIIQL